MNGKKDKTMISFEKTHSYTAELLIRQTMCHRPEQVIIERRNIWEIRRVGQDFPFERFQISFNGFGNVRPSVLMLQNHFLVPLLVLWAFFKQCSAQTHQLCSIPFPSDRFVQFQQLIINNFSDFEGFWPSFTRTVVNIEITVFDAKKTITTRCFTQTSISVNFLELSMRFSFSSNKRIESTLTANDDYLAQNQTFSHNQKYMTSKPNN